MIRKTIHSHLAIFIAFPMLIAMLLSTGCAMYQFGNATLHNKNVRSVHIQMFENDTYRRGLGPWLTEAIVKEVQVRTPYQITDFSNADSFLRGRIVQDRKSIQVESINDEGRDISYSNQLEVTWTDRSGVPLAQRRIITITEDTNFIPEAGQSITTAQQELVQRLAKQVVNQMEIGW